MDHQRRLWEYRWVRDLFYVVLVLLALLTIYTARAVTLPILIGMALAYAFDPLVRWAKVRLTMSRWLSTLLLLLMVVVLATSIMLYILPGLLGQAGELIRRLPSDAQYVVKQAQHHFPLFGAPIPASQPAETQPAMTQPAPTIIGPSHFSMTGFEGVDIPAIASFIADSLGIGLGLVRSTITATAYLLLAAVLVCICFFYFSWKFDRIIAWFDQFIPPTRRDHALAVIRRMDRSVSAFFRGRIIQALLVGLELIIGWRLAGVPYWLLLGFVAGVLHMIPYGAMVIWPIAVLLTWINPIPGVPFSAWHVFFWPTLVYVIAQSLDGWLIEPMVQGKATDLDPLTVMLSVLIGGTLLGLPGMIMAVPTAACVKILSQEVVLPRIRRSLGTQKD